MRAWTPVAVLLGILAAAVYVGYLVWTLTDAAMPATGYVAMALTIFFSLRWLAVATVEQPIGRRDSRCWR
jgi:hypothetical protein